MRQNSKVIIEENQFEHVIQLILALYNLKGYEISSLNIYNNRSAIFNAQFSGPRGLVTHSVAVVLDFDSNSRAFISDCDFGIVINSFDNREIRSLINGIYLADFIRSVFSAHIFHRNAAALLSEKMKGREYLDLWAVRRNEFGDRLGDQHHLSDLLIRFLQDEKQNICCITGSYGTGKSASVIRFCAEQLELPAAEEGVLPIYVDLSGRGRADISQSISEAIAWTYELRCLPEVLTHLHHLNLFARVVLVFDGLDEQYDVTPRAVSRLFRSIRDISMSGLKTILAFRPEIFDNFGAIGMIFNGGTEKGAAAWTYIQLEGLSPDVQLETELRLIDDKGFVRKLIKRPLWHGLVREYAEISTGESHSIVKLLEYCLANWEKREQSLPRPILPSEARKRLLRAIAVHAFQAQPAQEGIPRRQALELLLGILQSWQEDLLMKGLALRTISLSPDATTQALSRARIDQWPHHGSRPRGVALGEGGAQRH